MPPENACPVWRPDDCDGTRSCPPRCPRYVTDDGTSCTVYPLEERSDRIDRSGLESEPDIPPDGYRDGDPALVAVDDGDRPLAFGFAVADDGAASVTLEAGADPEVGTELARQLVARRRADDGSPGTLSIRGPRASLSRLAAELGDGGTFVDLESSGAADETDSRDEEGVLEVDLESPGAARTGHSPARRADVAAPRDVGALVDPETVAVVGATDREGSIGRLVVENLRDGFEGEVVPVTDRHESVLGLETAPSLSALRGDVDLAVVVLPRDAALEAVREAGETGVDAVAVLSAGFGESDDEGASREAELRELAAEHDLALIGPNALGVASTRGDMNASFAPEIPSAGGVSVLSHSGAMITAILDWADAEGVGVRDVVSLGNAAGLDEATLLRHWGRDPETSVVLAYLEDVSDGRAFVEAAREVTASTPVVALKSGRSEAGREAAASHTGALLGDDAGFDAAFDEAGVIRVDSQRSLYDLVALLESQPLPAGDRVAVVTNAGGPGVLATDAVAASDLSLAEFGAETERELERALPDAASAANPVDVLGDADVDRFVDALETVLAAPSVDAAIVVTTPHPLVSRADLARAVGDAGRRYGVPVVTCFSGGPLEGPVQDALSAAGVPNYPDAERAATALGAAASYAADRREPRTPADPVDADHERVESAVRERLRAGETTLGVESLDALEAYGVSTPAATLATTRAEAVDAAREIGGPVAMKAVTPALSHKTDVGGVAVDVPPDEAGETYDRLRERVASNAPGATVRGVLVQEMAPDGVECLVGVTRHPRFGPLVTFGLGGVFVEHLEDVAHALAPLSRFDAEELIRSIEADGVLEGARGRPPADVDALGDALVRLSWLAVEQPAIRELEVNPLVVTGDDALAVDFQAELEGAASEATARD
ncbi:CoA-binding protein [Halobiforma lacisalsi AJ5]|uniref:acetate--CoA ligase (ADP-forming) n=1 Tax=Natronobacterium lacisalsi AJ5 TaxID=358396 RepID=M0LTY4_NATLA|nr:acetate--CoA ligase [Halobiforma lacisalsi]APW99941.1 CoA-binding protein [Halobiforma lacisalsi AJ5]EMA35869.1 CoA-binding domain protein [Halobiforma lacisalsi AJ5]